MIPSGPFFDRVSTAPPRHLLQFKAGKLNQNSDNWVHADPRKGWVYVYQSGDGKLHFSWIDRKTCLVEDDFVIARKQAEFKKVTQCSTGRVYLLNIKGQKRFFIWMQEPSGKNDSDICNRINDFIKSPPALNHPSDWPVVFSGLSNLGQSDILDLISIGCRLGSGLSSESDVSSAQATTETIGRHLNTGHLSTQPKVTSVLGSGANTSPAVGASGNTSASTKRTEGGKIQLQDLRNILSSVTASKDTAVDLNSSINVDSLRSLLEKPEVQERLKPYLPPTDPDAKPESDLIDITTNIRSSQFKSTLKSFSSAFQTGELAPLLAQFKLGAKADEAARKGDLVAFSRALQTSSESKTTNAGSSKSPDPTQDDKDKSGKSEDSSPDKKDSSGTKMDTD